MTEKTLPDMIRLPPPTSAEIASLLKGLAGYAPEQVAKAPRLVVVGAGAMLYGAMASMSPGPWIKDAQACGPALEKAIARYLRVFDEMGQARNIYTCIDKRQGAMAAAIETYLSLVSEQQINDAKQSFRPLAAAVSGFLVASLYHDDQARTCKAEADRLRLALDRNGDRETLKLWEEAVARTEAHIGFANDMRRMAMGEKPENCSEEFAQSLAG